MVAGTEFTLRAGWMRSGQGRRPETWRRGLGNRSRWKGRFTSETVTLLPARGSGSSLGGGCRQGSWKAALHCPPWRTSVAGQRPLIRHGGRLFRPRLGKIPGSTKSFAAAGSGTCFDI